MLALRGTPLRLQDGKRWLAFIAEDPDDGEGPRSQHTARLVPIASSDPWITPPATPERSGCRSRELTGSSVPSTTRGVLQNGHHFSG